MKTRYDLYGTEFNWFATDSTGAVGLFVSRGFGPIPSHVFDVLAELEQIQSCVESLPQRSQATLSREVSWHDPVTTTLAHRGLYCFEWREPDYRTWEYDKGPYRLAAIPELPITVSDLPVNVTTYLKPFQFSDCIFEKQKKIDIWKYFDCTTSPCTRPL